MAIGVVGTPTTGTSTATAPTGSTTGTLLVVAAAGPSGTTITVPAGWSTQLNSTTSNSYTNLRLVIASAPWSGTLAMGFTSATLLVCSAYSGTNTSSPWQTNNFSTETGSGTTITTPSVSDTTSGGWRVEGWGCAGLFSSTTAWTTFSPADTIHGETNTSNLAIAITDSNGTIGTGSTSVTGTIPDTNAIYDVAMAWIGILVPLSSSGSNFFFF